MHYHQDYNVLVTVLYIVLQSVDMHLVHIGMSITKASSIQHTRHTVLWHTLFG